MGQRTEDAKHDYPPIPDLTSADFTTVVGTIDLYNTQGRSTLEHPWPGFPFNKGLIEYWAALFEAYVTIPSDAVYWFDLGSDDGARMHLSDRTGRSSVVVDNAGDHDVTWTNGSIFLTAGTYKVPSAHSHCLSLEPSLA